MRHIVFLEQYGSLGGGQQVLLELVRAALALPCRVSVLIPEGPCVDKLQGMGATVRLIPACRLSQGKKTYADMVRFATYSWRIFLQHMGLLRSADLIYINGNRLLGTGMLAQLFLRRRAACHIHLNHGPMEQKLFLLFLKSRKSLALIVPSAFILRQLQAAYSGFTDPRVRLVPNGLDSRFSNIPFEDRFTDRPLRHVGIVGRVSPEKGQDVLLPLAKRFPELHFHVLGDAAFSSRDFYDELRQKAPVNVHFHGWVDDLPAKVREIGLQVCLVPSRCEEAAPLVPLQLSVLSCLVMVRQLRALEDVAKELQLRTFAADRELEALLESLAQASSAALVKETERAHDICNKTYGHTGFQSALQKELTALMALPKAA